MKSAHIMGKVALRDIRKNSFQYLSMVLINMLAVTLFCGFVSNAVTLDKTLNAYYADANLADLVVSYASISQADKEFLHGIDDVTVEYRLYGEGSMGNDRVKLYVAKPDSQISVPLLASGSRGVLVDKHANEMDGLGIGDEIELTTLFGNFSFVVSGFMTMAEAANTHNYTPLYLDHDAFFSAAMPSLPPTLYDMQFDRMCNQAVLKTASAQAVKAEIAAHYEQIETHTFLYASDRDAMESVVMLQGEVSQSLKMIYVFPVIFLLVSALVVLSTIGPLILRERTTIGILKSIGFSNRKIVVHYALFGAILCLVGGILGAITGPFIVPRVLSIKYNLVYSMPPFAALSFSPFWSMLAIMTVSLLAALIGLFICYKTVREKTAVCLRPPPPKENFLLSRMQKREPKGSARAMSATIALRNIVIKPSRALMTIIGIMGCVALLACSFGVGDTVTHSIDYELGEQFTYDIAGSVAHESQSTFLQRCDDLKRLGSIEHVELYKIFSFSASKTNQKDIRLYVLDADATLTTIRPDGQVLISRSVAEDLGAAVGDEVRLSAAGNLYTVTIDAVIESSFTKGIFVSETSRFDDSFYTVGAWLKAPEVTEQLLDELNAANGMGGMRSMESFRRDIDTAISSIDAIQLTMRVFAILLAVVVLYNLSLLNIKERSRDIATMKVLGFSIAQISRTLLYEMMILVCVGTIFGLILGYPITVLVMGINRIEVLTFLYTIKPLSYLYAALVSLVTAWCINLLFLIPIRKIHMVESLKSVE